MPKLPRKSRNLRDQAQDLADKLGPQAQIAKETVSSEPRGVAEARRPGPSSQTRRADRRPP